MRIAEVAFPVPLHQGFHYRVDGPLAVLPGMRVRAPFGPRHRIGTVLSVFEGQPQRELKSLEAVLDAEPILPRELLDCALWMSRRYGAPIGECLKAFLPSYLKSLPEGPAGDLEPRREAVRSVWTLTQGQDGAVKELGGLLEARRYGAALVYGVPASGKTEVYLRLIREAASRGGQSLFLVPEISLTQPFFEEFSAALDVPVVLWHSRLSPRERRSSWLGLRSGALKVVVGARSAALLPFKDLRLIVIDEEQDESFKQESQSPLYHVREVCLHRARAFGALAVLGSATPSLEAWEMARRGEAKLIAMPDRVSSVARPAVKVLPLPSGRCLSEELLERVKARLALREQSILLVNRRGFSTLVLCLKCGWVDRCPSCGVAKIQHEEPDGTFILRCHHCSRKSPMPARCPKCAGASFRLAGTGTQKVVRELKKALPGARVLRMDRDSLSQENKQDRRIYEEFQSGQADILVGTKLVAKSFHFPNVTLVGVVDADTMLHMPDFRSSERTMQLLAQVAGRSGRADKKGEVLLQTLHPEHAAIAKAVEGDYAAFAEAELLARRELGYPPYSVLVRLVWTGPKEEAVSLAAQNAAERLRSELSPAGHEVVGPAPAVLRMASRKFRYHLLLKVPGLEELERALAAARACPAPSGVRMRANVDPYDLF